MRELQAVIGREARAQMLERAGGLPDAVFACVGGGSNAIGLFHAFLGDAQVEILGVEAGGRGAGLGDNAATLVRPARRTARQLLDPAAGEDGQIQETHSISAGLDYPGVGPEHALLRRSGACATRRRAMPRRSRRCKECCECEGILPAIESAHALAGAQRWAAAASGGTDPDRTVRARR